MKKYNTVTMREAAKLGYQAITSPYNRNELDMLDNVIRDMQGCDYLLVEEVGGTAVYRKKTDLEKIRVEVEELCGG
jgi:hypothetical protein